MFILRLLSLSLIFSLSLSAEKIETFYGTIDVEEPVLLELIHSPAFQRLKRVHQYGVSYYTSHREEYNRFDHSIGVFTILRAKGASLLEQIAGLLHDASHTTFSHVGDWVFQSCYQGEDYQTAIHEKHLTASGIGAVLEKYGYTVDQILPTKPEFTMLEQPLPNLSADRIDYNIQGAHFRNFLTKKEALELFYDLSFTEGKWVCTRQDLAGKLMQFSLFMTEDCWGSAENHLLSTFLAEAIIQGIKIGEISSEEFHFGYDDKVWDKLKTSSDPLIQDRMHRLDNISNYYCFVNVEEADAIILFKCRGVDPWILQQGEIIRLTTMDHKLEQALRELKNKAMKGWAIQLKKEPV